MDEHQLDSQSHLKVRSKVYVKAGLPFFKARDRDRDREIILTVYKVASSINRVILNVKYISQYYVWNVKVVSSDLQAPGKNVKTLWSFLSRTMRA